MIILLVFLFFNMSRVTACPLDQCTSCSKALVSCTNFTSFSEINLSNLTEIEVLELRPSVAIYLDNSLVLHSNITITKQLILQNIKGIICFLMLIIMIHKGYMVIYRIGFIYNQNPFEFNIQRSIEVRLYNSTFQFYEANTTKLDCTVDRFQNASASILQHFSRIWLNEYMKFDGDLCPIVFKNARINFFLCQNMTEQNRLQFNQSDFVLLNSSVSYLALINSNLDHLDQHTVHKQVFKNLKTFQILGNQNLKYSAVDSTTFSNNNY